ncbi:MAG: hypothetical protein KDM63_18710, partial [Verrucomicrobiae bacterium]|nr:hypothetical protein [Verrucomicrobiae bacterium]
LRFFYQVRWYPVSAEELLEQREAFLHGSFNPRIEQGTFSLRKYAAFLEENAEAIQSFKDRQQAAFEEERERWAAAGVSVAVVDTGTAAAEGDGEEIPEGMEVVESFMAANVWRIFKAAGDEVEAGERVAILEAMKTEFTICAPRAGTVWKVTVTESAAVRPGQPLLYLNPL